MTRKTVRKAKKPLPTQKFYWHFMRCDGELSYQDNRKPKLGQWMKFKLDKHCKKWVEKDRCYVQETEPSLCGQGMHAALKLKRTDTYNTPGIRLARVELGKIYNSDSVKAVSDKRRIIELWTPLKVRNAILLLAREKVVTLFKKELKWWTDNCPFNEVREAIELGNMEKFEQFKSWLSIPIPYGIDVPLGVIEGARMLSFHPCATDSGLDKYMPNSNREDRLKSRLHELEKTIKAEKKMPVDHNGQPEIDILNTLFDLGLTEQKLLKVLGPGRKAKK